MTDNSLNSSHPSEKPLESWKEIAAYLKRDVRTVKRWEKKEALPVRRHMHEARSSVYAYPSELDAWWTARKPEAEKPALAGRFWLLPARVLALGAILLLALVATGGGPGLTPAGALAGGPEGVVVRQVWAGPDVDTSGAVSPDGGFLSFVDWETGDLAVRDLTTGQKRRLTNKGSWFQSDEFALLAVVSPDSRQVAYSWWNQETFDLRLISLDGSAPRILLPGLKEGHIEPGGWSPDGKHVLAVLAEVGKVLTTKIALIAVADGSIRVLKTLDWRWPGKAAFSPDGRYIAYDFPPREGSPQRDIFLLAVDGTSEVAAVQHPAHDLLLGWSPDGASLLFSSDRTGTTDCWLIRVADGKPQSAPELVKKNIGSVSPLGITRNGSFFYGLQTSMEDVYVAEVDFASGTILAPPKQVSERFIGSNRSPDWSPDGQYLAYVSSRGRSDVAGSRVLVIRSIQSGEERELSLAALRRFGSPSWSADGRFLVAVAAEKQLEGIYRIDAQSGSFQLLVASEPTSLVRLPLYSPDGKALLYARGDPSRQDYRIVRRDLRTGKEKELYRTEGKSVIQELAPSFDGRHLAVITFEEKGASALKILPATGGQARELLRVEAPEMLRPSVAWTPDGRSLVLGSSPDIRGTTPRIIDVWRIPAEGGERHKLALTMPGLFGLRIHPDGHRLAFKAGEYKAEVWVMENFLPSLKTQD